MTHIKIYQNSPTTKISHVYCIQESAWVAWSAFRDRSSDIYKYCDRNAGVIWSGLWHSRGDTNKWKCTFWYTNELINSKIIGAFRNVEFYSQRFWLLIFKQLDGFWRIRFESKEYVFKKEEDKSRVDLTIGTIFICRRYWNDRASINSFQGVTDRGFGSKNVCIEIQLNRCGCHRHIQRAISFDTIWELVILQSDCLLQNTWELLSSGHSGKSHVTAIIMVDVNFLIGKTWVFYVIR